ncbi:tyrosine-protein kinase receptor Tie-1 [Trichonephila inaurata madagascariensis]|uniref:Tyrosine-protein kinase receptor Tie-1 n=1 Tax=Trichonephila inaurata madagascariensis TaxID=2747483 RepID=A0A8X6WLL4_9ARAC|nr:tyrosine-protein kinase receptor Tie-1 [Trichonephila inaurata madagascariensis]
MSGNSQRFIYLDYKCLGRASERKGSIHRYPQFKAYVSRYIITKELLIEHSNIMKSSIFICIIFSSILFMCIKRSLCISGPELIVSNVTENKVHVEWTPVQIPNKVVEKYQVSAYPLKSYSTDLLKRNEWTFSNTSVHTDLIGLHPGTMYNISIWAVTSDGHTDPSTKIVWTEVGDPEEPLPVEILEKDRKTMLVNLPIGYSDKGPITSYYVVPIEKGPIILFNQEEVSNYSMSKESGLPFYIAANLTPEEANKSFTIGDGKMYNGYYNAPLSEERDYEVLVGVVSSLNEVTKVAYSPLQSTLESRNRPPDVSRAQTSSTISVILSAAIGVCGFLLVLSVILYFLLRRHYGKRRPSDEMVLRVHGSEGDENGFVPGMLHISEDADLSEVYENIMNMYSLKRLQIPRSNLVVHQTVLGVGQFGEVREGTAHKNSQPIPCIVQHMQAPSLLSDKEKRALFCELDLMARVGTHSNVVQFLGACDERDILQVAIEHHPSSLRGLLLRSRQPPGDKVSSLSEPLLLELSSGIAQGMAHLADRGILHRHLSARNVLIAEGSIPKVAHFGLGYYNPLGKKLLYTRWTAPEVLNLNNYTSKSDVWAFGVLLWELFTLGGSPYVNLPARDILPRVMQGMRLPQPKGVFDELFQLLLHCWELDSDERPPFMELATSLQQMILHSKEHINFQDCVNYQYAKFDPNAEDQ